MPDNIPSNECALIDGVIYCQCGQQWTHYGTMGERGAREVRCEAPPKEHRPSKKLFRDRFVDVWYELTSSPAMHTLRYSSALELMAEADREIKRLQQLVSDHGINNLEDRDEYARCRSISDEQIIREAMETPIRMVHELGNRYDVVCEKLEKASEPPPESHPWDGKRVYIIPVMEQHGREIEVERVLRNANVTFWVHAPVVTKEGTP